MTPRATLPTTFLGSLVALLSGLTPLSAWAEAAPPPPPPPGAAPAPPPAAPPAAQAPAGATAPAAGSPAAPDNQAAATAEPAPTPPQPPPVERSAASGQVTPMAQEAAVSAPSAPIEPALDKVEPAVEAEEPSWTDHLKWKADLRYRLELIGIDAPGRVLRHRHRVRARAGLHAQVLDGLDAVIQLGTGSSDDPVSSNQTLGNAFSSKPIWLDLGYFDYHPGCGVLHLLGGKMKNPFYAVGKSELLWDPDLNPEGLALKYQPKFGSVEPFLNAGYLWSEERSTPADTFILGGQAGLKVSFETSDLYALAGGRYIDHMNIENQAVLWDPTDSFGNTATDTAGDGTLTYDFDYNLLGAFAEFGGKVGGLPWAVFADFVQNTAVSDNGAGWLLGASLGKCRKALDVCGRYIYKLVEADAVVGIYTDSDFNGGGTNAKGHEFNAGLQLAEGVETAATYFYNKTSIEHGEDFHRLQLDLQLKF